MSSRLVPALLLLASVQASAQTRPGLPRFDRAILLDPAPDTSANASLGDVDGDGHLDIVLSKGRHWPAVDRVLLGDGQGGFLHRYPLSGITDRSYSGRLTDLDGDGDLDVVVSNDRPDPKRVYLNDGRGHFRAAGQVGDSSWPTRNAAVVDLDGDGLPEVVFANRTGRRGGGSYYCSNLGGGRFDQPCRLLSEVSSTTISAADFDGDGRPDLVVPHRDGGQSLVHLNGGASLFDHARTIPFGPPDATIRMAEAGDFDGDGRMDIVAIDERVGIRIFLASRDGRFGEGVRLGEDGAVPYALAVADLDLDGRLDVVVGFIRAPSALFVNRGVGRFEQVSFGDGLGAVYGFAVGDLNEDGRPDIVAARSGAPSVLYLASP